MVHEDPRNAYTRLRMESGKVQALDIELVTALTGCLERAVAVGAPPLIVTGTGGSFSAGVDLFRALDGGPGYIRRFLPALSHLLHSLFAYPGPVVAAINGHAVAGGALLAWCADMRVMAAGKGRIGVPELRVGVPFPAAAVEILRFAAAGRGVQALAYLGTTMLPDEALAAGLVDEVVPLDLLEERTVCVAEALARIPPASFRLTKDAIRRPHLQALAAHGESIDERVLAAWCDPATIEAVRHYLERTFGTRQ